MLTLCAALALAQSQPTQIPVMDSRFLMHEGSAYVASPTYMLGHKGDQAVWSQDSKRVAFVTWHPATMSPRLAGETLGVGRDERLRINVWNADLAQADEAYLGRPSEGIQSMAFLGQSQDLVIATFSGSTVETSRSHLIYKRAGARAAEVNLGTDESFLVFPSPTERAVLVTSKSRHWLIMDGETLILNPPVPMTGVFMATDGTVQLLEIGQDKNPGYYSFDFRTRKYTSQTEFKERAYKMSVSTDLPFLVDVHQRGGASRFEGVDLSDLSKVDSKPFRMSDEDGGLMLHLIEASGERRRRLPFIFEMSRYFWVSPDGMTVVYQSQQMLCARKLLKCDAETTQKWLAQGT